MILDGLKFESSNVISNEYKKQNFFFRFPKQIIIWNINFLSYVFWFGDLNFRIENFTFEEVIRLIDANYVGKLLEYDQVGKTFEDFLNLF